MREISQPGDEPCAKLSKSATWTLHKHKRAGPTTLNKVAHLLFRTWLNTGKTWSTSNPPAAERQGRQGSDRGEYWACLQFPPELCPNVISCCGCSDKAVSRSSPAMDRQDTIKAGNMNRQGTLGAGESCPFRCMHICMFFLHDVLLSVRSCHSSMAVVLT